MMNAQESKKFWRNLALLSALWCSAVVLRCGCRDCYVGDGCNDDDANYGVVNMTEYQYHLKRMGASSDKYGPCEVCGKHISDVFHQTESRYTERGRWTFSGCHNLFGHEDCLISKRR